jgi:hypothetical protein
MYEVGGGGTHKQVDLRISCWQRSEVTLARESERMAVAAMSARGSHVHTAEVFLPRAPSLADAHTRARVSESANENTSSPSR